MTNLFKKISLAGFLLLFVGISLQAQIAVLQYRSVPQDNVAEFLHRETTYWSQVAKKAIADGKLMQWALWQRVGGVSMDENSHNFVFVNVFADKTGLDHMGDVWDVSKALPDARWDDIETNSLSKVVHQIVVEFNAVVGMGGKFATVNYAKVKDMEKFVAFETGVWQPFISKLMEEKKTSCVGWNLATVLKPGGTAMPFDAFTADHYNTMSEAVQPTWDESVEFPDFTPYTPTMERVMVQVYGLVKKEEMQNQ